LAGTSTPTTHDAIAAMIVDALATMGPEREFIKPDSTFEELDIDSLDLVELTQMVQDDLGLEIRPDDLNGVTTVGQVIDLVASRAS
jgi:acyl carrier protein